MDDKGGRGLALWLAALTLIVAGALFIVALIVASQPATDSPAREYATLDARALETASAQRGAELIVEYACSACHVAGEGRVAPLFAGIAGRASSRRSNLSASEYLRESIVSPGAYLVEGYANAMPGNYGERLSDAQIADIVAFLLTLS